MIIVFGVLCARGEKKGERQFAVVVVVVVDQRRKSENESARCFVFITSFASWRVERGVRWQ